MKTEDYMTHKLWLLRVNTFMNIVMAGALVAIARALWQF